MHEIEMIMTTDVVTIHRQTPIIEAIDILLKNNITGLPVINSDGSIAGVISEKDVMCLLSDSENIATTTENFMTEDVVSFDVTDDLIAVCECLVNNHFRRVLITENGKLAGIVSRRDIIKYILEPIG